MLQTSDQKVDDYGTAPEQKTVTLDGPENRQLIYDREDAELVATLRRWYLEDLELRKEARARKESDWRMYAGDQWEQEAKERAAAEKRPLLTLNYMLPTASAVEGEERSNRQEIKIYGRREEDDPGAEGFNLLIRWIMNECNGEYSLSTAFRHMTVCGEGWIFPDVDYFNDPEGQIVVRHVDETEIVNDSQDISPDASMSRRLTRMRWVKDDELEGMFPGGLAKISAACGRDYDMMGRETDGKGYRDVYTAPGNTNTKVYDAKKREWLVLEHWWFEIAPGYAAVDPASDSIVELTMEEGDALKEKHQRDTMDHVNAVIGGTVPFGTPAPQAPQMVQRPIRRYFQAFTCHEVLLGKNPHPVPEARRFPYIPAFGFLDKLKKEWFGPLRNVKDAQRQHNVEQSSIVHLMQLLPKAGWKAPRGAFHDRARWENAAARPGVTLEYNANKGEPKPIEQTAIPRHMIDMAMTRMQSMRDISGVNIEMTGQRQGDDAGVVMEMRKKAALTMLSPLFDNFRLTKKVLGRLLIVYIQKYVSTGRRFRVIGPTGGAEYVTMTEEMSFARYDAIIDETSATVNDRIQTLNLLQTVLPTIIDAGIPVPPGLIDMFPIPPHVKTEWKALVQQQMAAQQAPQPGMTAPAPQ